jgi:tetratricopeptide (TPR) repeat protein/predicted Ser/Thr protein kinase
VTSSSRLERALAIYLQVSSSGEPAASEAALADHPDLRDLLEPLLRPEPDAGAATPEASIGDFDLRREVGRGGMGIVYEARQRSLGRRVALKVLAETIATDPARIARFRREATMLAQLEHPHVVRVLDAGDSDGRHWLAMEFVDGESLDQRLQRLAQAGGHHEGSLRELVAVVQRIADALAHVHDAGILHRDIKPSNILLTHDGSPRLSDFGLARATTSLTLTAVGALAGTPHYLAPEYVTRGEATAAGDIWSLGATLYEVVTLRRPFDAPSEALVLHRIVHHAPVDPRRHVRTLPADLAAIVLRALEKDPAARYPGMRAFAADLQAFLDLRPTVARPPSLPQRLRRWVRREPARAALAAVAAVAIGLSGLLLARLPTLRAGERAAAAAAYESAIAEGFLRRADGRADLARAAAATARELRPEAGEAIVVEVLQTLRFDSAEAALQQLERLIGAPHDDDEACRWLRVLILGRSGRSVEADALAQQLGEPRSQVALLLAAGRLVDGQTKAGLQAARELVSLATRIGPPRLLVHAQWAVLVRPEERVECATALLRLWPEHPFALHLAATLLQWSDAPRALALQQKALRLGLQDQWGRYNEVMYAHKAGANELAVSQAREVLRSDPISDERRAALIQVLTDLAPEQVGSALQDWATRVPDSAFAARESGWWHRERDEPAAALPLFRRAVAKLPRDVRTLQGLALVLQDLGDAAASLPLVAELLTLAPALDSASALQLHALRATGASAAAIHAELQRWAEQMDTAPAWRELASAALAAADLPLALHALQRADAVDGGDDTATLELAVQAHERAGEAASAAAARQRLARARAGR